MTKRPGEFTLIKSIFPEQGIDLISDGNQEYIRKTSIRGHTHSAKEMRMFNMFSHPNICKLLNSYEELETTVLIMEYCNKGDLFDYGIFTESMAKKVLKQIIPALQHIHSLGYIHGDLKLENIVCHLTNPCSEEIFKLIDFEFCQKMGDIAPCMSGTPQYFTPEMTSMRSGPAKASVDYWGVGVICYLLACSQSPFDTGKYTTTLLKIRKAEYFSIPVRVSQECRNFIEKTLKVDPEQRMNFEEMLAHPFLK